MNRATGRSSASALVGCLLAVVGASAVLPTSVASAQIRWKSGGEQPIAKMGKREITASLEAFQVAMRGEAAKRRLVVTLDRPVTGGEKDLLKGQGITLLNYLSDNSYFASIDAERLDPAGAAALGLLTGISEIERDRKLHPELVQGVVQPWAIVSALDKPAEAQQNPTVAAYIMFHEDADFDREGLAILDRHGVGIVSEIRMVNGAVIEIPADQIKALADEDGVMWIEPPMPQFEELNFENRIITGANTAFAAPYNLTGAGVTVLVFDGGTIRTTHQDFQGRATNIDTDAVSDHATHVSGTIGGGGVADPTERGMAPGVLLKNAGFEWAGGNGFLYTDPGDLVADYTNAITNHGAHIANNSIGNNTEPNGYPCDRQGDYGFVDTIIDAIARGSINGQPFRIVWAAGNERQGSRCDVETVCGGPCGDYYSSAPPGNAKNHITVGALNANNDSMTSFSSWGPSDDGRLRPDISGPGCESGGDGGVRSCASSSDTGYSVKCGTSMSSPTVCGLSALLIQDFRAQYPSLPDMRASTLKAIWMHTAQDVFNPGPDYMSGYGSVRVVPAIELIRSGNFFEAEVAQGGVYTATVVVQPNDTQLKVTIAWDDPPGTPNVNPTLVNDLDLVVSGPGGTYFPWTLNPTNPSANAVRTTRNFRDNNEQVLIDNPMPGAYLVEVRGFNVPQGPQSFSLCASPFLVNCSSQGVASLDRNTYNCNSLAGLRVVDCDLNTSDSVIDTVTVHIASTTDSGFPIVLTEVAPEAATFAASIQLSTMIGGATLQVAHGDTVTLTYMDADDGGGMPATVISTANVDCAGPVISNVDVPPGTLAPRSAVVTFSTNEPAVGVVRYGTSCGSLTESASGPQNTSHTISLPSLMDDTAYFFTIEATDASGNMTIADNGGSCFTFMTPEVPDYFTELFSGADIGDLDFKSIMFTPNGTFEGYDACIKSITALPVDPTLGTLMNLPDDSPSTLVPLTDGKTVKLYGASYASVWVNCNGNLSFTASDTALTESLATHFNKPRVSALFDDLNDTQGGDVRRIQLDDRFVVTYLNVPQHNAGDQNTFQYELFFDGRIRLSYLAVGSNDHIIGLSRGGGTPADFFESDLSAYGSCGPTPPIASHGSVTTPIGDLIPVVLSAQDDGLPDPPAALTYVIKSLPAYGRLFDPGASQISSTPYTLVGGGNIVHYDPYCSHIGNDSFTFAANDSGTPPLGGDSNIATVSVMVGGPSVIHSFLVDDSNPGWTGDPAWAFGQPTGGGGSGGGGSGTPDPTAGFTGMNVLGYNLAGNYTNNMAVRNLTSNAIDCSGRSGVQVRFRRWLGIESSVYDSASFQISTNGTTWSTVWAHSGAALNPTTGWSLESYDISALADNQATVYLRWVIGPTDGSVVYCGWNIDDIELLANIPPEPCPNDYNGDCEVNFSDISYILGNWSSYSFNDVSIVLAAFGQSCNN